MAIILAFVSAVGWGASDFVGGYASKRHAFLTVALIREALQLLLVIGVLVAAGGTFYFNDFALSFGLGLLVGMAFPVFYRALSTGRMSVIAPVTGIVAAGGPILFGLATGERPGILQLIGLLLAIASVGFISVEHVVDEVGDRRRHFPWRDVFLALGCGFVFACYFVVMHHTNSDSGYWPLVGVSVGALLVLLTLASRSRTSRPWVITKAGFGFCLLGVVFETVSNVSFLLATRQGLLSVTAGVASLYPVFTALLAMILLRERLSRINVAGLVACAGSLALIAS